MINVVNIIVVIFVSILFFVKSYFLLDPDFGWHIKMGGLILKSGIPQTDPFSYTMPSYPFVDHEWLTNILLFIGHERIGWIGLVIIFSLITLLAVLIVLRFDVKNRFFVLPFILSSGVIFAFVGIRPQIISWLFFSVLTFLFLNKKAWQKYRIFLPLFFLLWANLHGGFILGLFIFSIFIAIEIYQEKKINPTNFAILGLSFSLTFLNPYGLNLHREVLISIFDSSLRFSIQEWMPTVFSYSPIVWIYIPASLMLLYKYKKSFSFFEKITYFFLFAGALSSVRNLPLWAIFASPILFKSLKSFSEEVKKYKFGLERFNKAHIFLLGLAIFALIFPIIIDLPGLSGISERNFYPEKAVGFLKKNPSNGQILSEYGWGGYLIWKMPSKKVFIDGRMPSWRRSIAPKNESNYIFKEYTALMNGNIALKDEVGKYNIDTILLPKQTETRGNFLEKALQKLEFSFKKEGKYGNIYKQVKKDGWKLIYQDKTIVVYRI